MKHEEGAMKNVTELYFNPQNQRKKSANIV